MTAFPLHLRWLQKSRMIFQVQFAAEYEMKWLPDTFWSKLCGIFVFYCQMTTSRMMEKQTLLISGTVIRG